MSTHEKRELAEQSELLKRLREVNSSDHPALSTPEKRQAVRQLFGFPAPVVEAAPHISNLSSNPIDALKNAIAYLQRGYSVRASHAGSSAQSGRIYRPGQVNELASSTFSAGNIPMNSALSIAYNDALVLRFDHSILSDVFDRFVSQVDSLDNVPVIVGQATRYALLQCPHGYRVREGVLPAYREVRAFTLSEIRQVLAPPSYDPAGGLKHLSWRDPAKTIPALPSNKLTKYLSTVAMVLEPMPHVIDRTEQRATNSQVPV